MYCDCADELKKKKYFSLISVVKIRLLNEKKKNKSLTSLKVLVLVILWYVPDVECRPLCDSDKPNIGNFSQMVQIDPCN